MVSSANPQNTLTVAGSASPEYTLKVMTVVALIFMPIVLCYQAWSLWTFRRRLGAPPRPVVSDGPVPPDSATMSGVDSDLDLAPVRHVPLDG
jgi:cytochrome d ubiquinol oxidase subunit II